MIVHPEKNDQIDTQGENQGGAQVGALILNKVPNKVLADYFDYSNVFLAKNIAELSEYFGMNNHTIELKKKTATFQTHLKSKSRKVRNVENLY